ncbi:MT-A70 family methyltransferase [Mesorhizobium sp.]|uniref:MT-A70 family methyltransferase n=1 Tax=Mesorhizobium sp. TaxID=1871066 RepID=UPI0025DA6FA3|nr:MT-A70 family methyltransferase [Mesorhizobium sp.]
MTMLAQYEILRQALAEAATVTKVLSIRDELQHLKLHAQQIRNRVLLAEAMAFQLRCERRLGVLLQAAEEAGQLARKGRPKASGDEPAPATLTEIGVDRKLSMKAKNAAALDDDSFEAMVDQVRENVASSKAIVVDPVKAAAKAAEIDARRAAHAARTLTGGCVADLGRLAQSGYRAKSIGSDPQWKFLTRSAAGDGRSANVHYKTEEIDKIKALPVGELLDDDGAFYMWMVDWCPQDALDLIAHYGLRHVTTAFTWVKTNPDGEGWHMGQGYWTRANPEQCWLATKGEPKRLYADVRQLIVAPVMEHSRKPDEWLERIERLTEGPYLELQARRPRKGWTSWGDELEFTGVAA